MSRKVVAIWLTIIMVLSLIVIIVEIAPIVGAQTTWYVDDVPGSGGPGDPPEDFTSIQGAINVSNDGDTVFVYNGTYYENVVVNKTINLTGEDRDATIIDGSGYGNVVYITSNWVNITYINITGSGSESDNSAIKLYEVYNCTISNNTVFNNWYGINPLVAHGNYILYNYFSHNSFGLHLWASQENHAYNNYYVYNDFGIYLGNSNNNHIISNNISNCPQGIYLAGSSNGNIINGNNISNSDQGIYIFGSSNGVIINENYISNSYYYGIRVRSSSGISIAGNKIFWKGIYLEGDLLEHWNTHHIDITNTINNKPVYYFKNQTGVSIPPGAGQVIISNCTDIIIKDQEIKNCTAGILVTFSSKCNITSTNVTGNQYGVYIFQSMRSRIINVSALNNTYGLYLKNINLTHVFRCNVSNNAWGVFFYFSDENIIEYSNVTSNVNYGIYLSYSDKNVIRNNNSTNNRFGLYLYPADTNELHHNNLSFNVEGIILIRSKWNNVTANSVWYNEFGIRVHDRAKYNEIKNNEIFNNDYGLKIESKSFMNNVSGNTISLNVNYGIYLTDASDNHIYHNNIIDNNIQAYDDQDNNYWDDDYPSGGNYWRDFNGIDLNCTPNQDVPPSDGLGDTPYIIDTDSQDNYPLMLPFTNRTFENYAVLKKGWNLISIPLIQLNQDLRTVLQMINGYYDAVQWYDVSDPNDQWKHHKVGKPFGNDLSHLNETIGFWIHITKPGETIFLYNGTQPTTNQTIPLHSGWNMVGYPSLTSYNRTEGLNNLTFGDHVDAIWSYNAATQKWEKMGESDYFQIGKGYYIHVKSECEWEVPL